MAQAYPLTHAAMSREAVADLTLIYTLPGSDRSLSPMLLLAHQDVVPVEAGTEGDWEAAPFSGAIQDGFVIGRGAADDKGSLVAILEAMEALIAQGFEPRRTIMFAFGHDEETMGAGAVAAAALLKQRGVKAWFVLDEGMAIVEDFPLTGAPVALIGIAEKGYMTVRVTARAAGGHSSTPPRDTAAEKLAEAILAIRNHPFAGGASSGPAAELLDAVAGDLALPMRAVVANRWASGPLIEGAMGANPASNALLRTTIAPTIVEGGTKENVLPQQMHAIVNLRLHPRDDRDSALAHLRAAVAGIEGVTVEVEGEANNPSPVSDTGSDSYALIAAAARAASPAGTPVAPMLVLGATDSRHYGEVAENTYRFAAVMAGSGELTRIHGTGERMSVENMGRMARFYAQLMAAGAR
jgi:carboxypeptidase PM20D1